MGTVDIFKSKGGRFCCSYFYAKFFPKRRKSRDIPGTPANQARRLPLQLISYFIASEKAYWMLSVSRLLVEAAVWLQQHGTTFAIVVFFLQKSMLPDFESKKENI